MAAWQTYQGELMFAKLVTLNTNSYPGVLGVSFYARRTSFNLVTTGGSPLLSAPVRISASQFQFLLTGSAGQNYTILSSSNLVSWSTNFVTNAPSSSFIVTVSNQTSASRYYRVLVGP